MPITYQLLVLVHLIGFAGLLGGSLAQIREPAPEINLAMLWGAWLEVLTGAGLVIFLLLSHEPVHWPPLMVKLVLSLVALLLVAKNRKFADIPRGLLGLIAVLAFADAAIAVLWT